MSTPLLIALAELWRWRRAVVLPALLGMALAGWIAANNPPQYTARVTLQLQADQARAPLLQRISAPGHRSALWQALTTPDVLADASAGRLPPLQAHQIELRVLNDYLMTVGVRDANPVGLATMAENLGYNFIQALLAPERLRVSQLLAEAQAELLRLDARPMPLAAEETKLRERTQQAIAVLQADLRLLDGAFGQQGSQTLLWFNEAAVLESPLKGPARWLLWLMAGGLMGGLAGWLSFGLPRRWRPTIDSAGAAQAATGLPVLGTLPWLDHVIIGPQGAMLNAGGKALSPAGFTEIGRLSRTLTRGLRGPLVVLAPSGQEGATLLALLLAERAAQEGKPVVLADFNLKNRTLTHKLLLGDGSWALPTGKGRWNALKLLKREDGKSGPLVLPGPHHPATLEALADSGGLPELLETLKKQAELVVCDASPLQAANRSNIDPVTLATLAGRVVLVALQDVTPPTALRQAADTLLLAGAPLQGVVLNLKHAPTRRQLLGQLADALGWAIPPLGRKLRHAAREAALD